MRVSNIFAILFFFIIQQAFTQKILHEFRGGGSKHDFNIHTVGDSILLQYEESLPAGNKNLSHWISARGKTIDKIDEEVFSVAESGGNTYFYFLDGRSKSRTLKAFVSDGAEKKVMDTSIPLKGTFIGKTTGEFLTLYILNDDGVSLTSRSIKGMTVVEEKSFKLPANFHDNAGENGIDFITSPAFTSFKGLSNIKFYHADSVMYVTLDRSKLTTLVIRIDLKTSEVVTKAVPFSGPENFSSFYLDGKLFRVSNAKRKFTLNIFDVETGALVSTSELPDTTADFKTYFRYGRKNIISHKASFSQMTGDAKVSWPSLAVEKVGDKYIIQWGGYYNQNSGAVAPTPSLAGVLSAVILTSVYQLREKPGVLRYFYYEWDGASSFKVRDYPPALAFLREKIDEYEIFRQTRVTEKSYIPYKHGVAAFYYDRPEQYLSVVYFE